MKKILLGLLFLFTLSLTSCRDERPGMDKVEVQGLGEDANDSDAQESFDTNPTPADPD
ncbi:hypothetical protein [Nonlabens sp. MIC269]|uniref:hypothetical protein n=1 Tax=Nonlabens sp. MIC269 TaxID=1476901 RepID=UPI000AE11CDD|nr:hypothetical protein [Nonlabens sp. MIC269]